MVNHLSHLHQLVVKHYDQEELHTLCIDLGLHYDELRGETLSNKAYELILKMGRLQKLDQLLIRLQQTRPAAFDSPHLSARPRRPRGSVRRFALL